MHLTSRLRTFFRYSCTRQNDGAAALEFALIAPSLLLLIFGIIEISLIFFVSSTLESATINTSRLGKTGFTASGISREQTLRNMLAQRTAGLLDMEKVVITSTAYPSFDTIGDAEPFQDTNQNGIRDGGESFDDINGNGQWDGDMGAEGLGDANDVVVYRISYPWEIHTPIISHLFTEDGIYNLVAHAVVKNEPYEIRGE